jgi:lipoprotein-anchoring transpeptidase ErfK/SrfK
MTLPVEYPMKTVAYAALGLFGLLSPALAAPPELNLEAVNKTEWSAEGGNEKEISPILVKAQVLLDRARFSPGVVDGRNGENMQNAIKAFEKARGLKPDGALDEELWAKLNEASAEPVLTEYTIRDEDLKGPFAKIPDKLEDQASLDRLGYSSPEELLAERFHMDQICSRPEPWQAVRRGRGIHRGGECGRQGEPGKQPEKVAKIEIVKSERVLRALAKDGAIMAVYPASIGSEEKPAPSGSHTVRAIAPNPNYTYNPDYAFKGVKAKEKFEIKPGPNNPVGSTWIDLSVESFGIHGTPEPEKVGKVYSQGCVRLTNWTSRSCRRWSRKALRSPFLD